MSADNCRRDLDLDLRDSLEIRKRITDDQFAKNLYASLCNNRFWHRDNSDEDWTISHRAAAALVADIRNSARACPHTEYYVDYYCCGNEGQTTSEITGILSRLGWTLTL